MIDRKGPLLLKKKSGRKTPLSKNIRGNSIKICFFLVLLGGLVSCLSIENQIHLQRDGSGSLEITYHLAEEFLQLGEDDLKQIPLPVSREDFERALRDSEGLRLLSYRQNLQENEILIRAKVAFASLSQLSQLWGTESCTLSLARNGTGSQLELAIPDTGRSLPENTLQLLSEFFSGNYFSYRISVPGKILSFNEGNLEDASTFFFKISICEIFGLKEEKRIFVNW